jgi:hypothetical protein
MTFASDIERPAGKTRRRPVPSFIDRTGQTFNAWTFARYVGASRWICTCTCGTERNLDSWQVVDGQTSSCGCLRPLGITARTPGLKRAHSSWRAMIKRCVNPLDHSYRFYGARGIRVCDRWLQSYASFLEDMGECPPQFSIERINSSGNYEPANCKWIDKHLQGRNRRGVSLFNYSGENLTVTEIARVEGLCHHALRNLTHRKQLPLEAALSILRSRKALKDTAHPIDQTLPDVSGAVG